MESAAASGWIDLTIQMLVDVATGNPRPDAAGTFGRGHELKLHPKARCLRLDPRTARSRLWDAEYRRGRANLSRAQSCRALREFQSGRQSACLGVAGLEHYFVGHQFGARDSDASGTNARDQQSEFFSGRKYAGVGFGRQQHTALGPGHGSTDAGPARGLALDCVSSVSFSPDGKTLVSGSRDSTVSMWDVDSDRPRRILDGHRSSISDVRFSPDGKSLASSSFDHTVRLWDLASGQTLKVFEGGSGVPEPQYSVSF